jgi:ferredoxin
MSVKICFLPDNVTVEAEVGEPLLQVADRAGLSIPTGCLMGSCYACEVELTACDSDTAETTAVRACISSVPAGSSQLTISLFVDPTW